MAFFLQQLCNTTVVSNAQTTLYAVPTGQSVRIDAVVVTNVDTVSRTISINLVPSGGSAASGNLTTKLQSILPGQTWNSPNEVGQVLTVGDFLSVIASAATALNIRVSGLVQV